MRPYLDFVHPHLPVLEWIAAAYIRVVGASYLRLELLNEAAIYITSILAFTLGMRVGGRPVAAASAILYAFSSLVFRYHAWERECFVAPLVLGALILALDLATRRRGWRAVAIGVLLAFACAIKLTAAIPATVILLYIAIAERRLLYAIAIGICIAAALAILSAFCYWRYGFDFIFQVFFFHFMKGRDTTGRIALYPAVILDLLAPLAILGVIALGLQRAIDRTTAVVIAMAAAEYIFFGLLSPTAWGHNYLEALPYIAIVAAIGATRIIAAARDLIATETHRRVDWFWISGGGALIIVCLALLTPLVNENWLRGSVYGFGFVPRYEISELASVIDQATAPGATIIAPSFVCFEANRIELVRFPETYGVYREARAEYAKYGFLAARARMGNEDFFRLIDDTAHYWTSEIQDAVTHHKVKVVISDSPIQMMPIVAVPNSLLFKSGYRPVGRTAHFVVWMYGGSIEATPYELH